MRKLSFKMIQYEVIQMLRNFFTPFFGIVFPILMLNLIAPSITAELSEPVLGYVKVNIFTTMVQVIPLAIGFMGFAAIYAQELEVKIPFRLKMFGISEFTQLYAKLTVTIGLVTISYLIYVCAAQWQHGIPQLTLSHILLLYVLILGELIGLILLAYTICIFFKKFGPAFSVVMFLYFVIMMGSGMMGIREVNMPEWIQKINRCFPFTYISNDMYKVFFNQTYNFMPLIQALIFFVGCTFLLFFIVIKFNGIKEK